MAATCAAPAAVHRFHCKPDINTLAALQASPTTARQVTALYIQQLCQSQPP